VLVYQTYAVTCLSGPKYKHNTKLELHINGFFFSDNGGTAAVEDVYWKTYHSLRNVCKTTVYQNYERDDCAKI
jgi:hypothetical protein